MKHITCPRCGKQYLTERDNFCPQCRFALTVPHTHGASADNGAPYEKPDAADRPPRVACSVEKPEEKIIAGKGKFSLAGIICFAASIPLIAAGAAQTYGSFSLTRAGAAEGYGQLCVSAAMIMIGTAFVILSILLSRCRIAVTNKRVTGRLPFIGKINIPIGSIREVKTLGMKTVCITDDRRTYFFCGVDNYREIVDAVFDQRED